MESILTTVLLKMHLPENLAVPLLGIYPRETLGICAHGDTETFTMNINFNSEDWKQSKYNQ